MAATPFENGGPAPGFIVAEVSCTWVNGRCQEGAGRHLSTDFERVLNANLERGYVLHSWRFNSSTTLNSNREPALIETIIAVFQLDRAALPGLVDANG